MDGVLDPELSRKWALNRVGRGLQDIGIASHAHLHDEPARLNTFSSLLP